MTDTERWDPAVYSKFLKARTRPARDLLFAIPKSVQPSLIYDLGCGPGNSTILLTERWPKATIIGVDSSKKMLDQARSRYPQIEFKLADITSFTSAQKVDLLFANASLQWLDNHELLIPRLVSQLNHQGTLAIQMPNNFHNPSHQITIKILQENPDWQPLLKKLRYSVLTAPLYTASTYYNLLAHSGLADITLWQTEYYQEMQNHLAIFEWASGTGLRPILTNLDEDAKITFRAQYVTQLKKFYPLQANSKVIFPFKRIFMVACNSKYPNYR